MDHVRGAPFHPQTQGKIERWHQTMKNRVLLENYYLPGDLEQQIKAFVEYYNNHLYHESLGNVTPADVYCGRDKDIIREREKIKKTDNQKSPLATSKASCVIKPKVDQSLHASNSSRVPNYLTTNNLWMLEIHPARFNRV